jgi:hypothetical protein
MQRTEFSLRYSGGISEDGFMDASDAERAIKGAGQLLSAHCHYFLKGQVPSRLTSSNKYFQVVVLPPTDGSWRVNLGVLITTAAITGAVHGISSRVAEQAYDVFLAQGVDRAFHSIADQPVSRWRLERSEHVALVWNSDEIDQNPRRDKLIEISRKAMDSIVYPIGRSAFIIEVRVGARFSWKGHLSGDKEPRHRLIFETPLNPGEDAQNFGE